MASSSNFLCPPKQCKLVKESLNINLNSPAKYINIKLLKLVNGNHTAGNTILSSPNTTIGSWQR